jgi:hypothetical protein
MRRIRLALPIALALMLVGVCFSADAQPDKKKVRIRARFTDKGQVGFTWLDADGKSQRLTSDPLGSTNIVAVRIDDRNYAFGFEGGTLDKPQKLDSDRLGEKLTWKVGKIEVTQTVETVVSKTGEPDTCLVTYTVVNKDDKPRSVGIRVGLDTMIGSNDGNPFRLPDGQDVITTQADFKGDKVPAAVLALENADLKKPGLVATLTLKVSSDLPAPDRVSLTHFPTKEAAFGWEIPMKDLGGDSFVVIYWEPAALKPGQTRTVGYAYGGGLYQK